MIDTSEILEAYLDGVLRLSGARCVSLYLAPMVGSGGEQRLLHVGDGDPVPELRDEEVALKFASAAAKKMTCDGNSLADSAVNAVPSAANDGVLVSLSLSSPLIRRGDRSSDAPEPLRGARSHRDGLACGSSLPRRDRLLKAICGGPSSTRVRIPGWPSCANG